MTSTLRAGFHKYTFPKTEAAHIIIDLEFPGGDAEELILTKVNDTESNEMKERVEMVRLPIMYLKCKRDPLKSKYDGTYEQFKNMIEREGITHFDVEENRI